MKQMSNSLRLMVNKAHANLPNQIFGRIQAPMTFNIFAIWWREAELVATICYSFTTIPSLVSTLPLSRAGKPSPKRHTHVIWPPCGSHLPTPSYSLLFFENFSSGSLSNISFARFLVISMTPKIIFPVPLSLSFSPSSSLLTLSSYNLSHSLPLDTPYTMWPPIAEPPITGSWAPLSILPAYCLYCSYSNNPLVPLEVKFIDPTHFPLSRNLLILLLAHFPGSSPLFPRSSV